MQFKEFVKELAAPLVRSRPQPQTSWEKSARLVGTIVNPGPGVSKLKAEEVVSALREQAAVAEKHVRATSRLQPSARHLDLHTDHLADVLVVDRPGWAHYAAKSMADLFGVDEAEPLEGVPDPTDLNGTVETTAVLTFLAQKTLGQFAPNLESTRERGSSPGQLLLVAPNVLVLQRAMAVDLKQFALWVSLHEYTHALQFAAADWLPSYMRERLETVVRSFDSESSLLEWARALAESLRGRDSVIDRLLNDQQREEIAKITALMTVLEGHAEVIMDLVPASVLPARRTLRRKFDARRKESKRLVATLGRVSGLDQKSTQYRVGAHFVREAQKQVGVEGFNRVFTAPEFLPTVAELEQVALWVERTDALLAASKAAEPTPDESTETGDNAA